MRSFRRDADLTACGDCQKVWVGQLLDRDAAQPAYFATAFADADPARVPELTRARLVALRVRDKDGKVVGGYHGLAPAGEGKK